MGHGANCKVYWCHLRMIINVNPRMIVKLNGQFYIELSCSPLHIYKSIKSVLSHCLLNLNSFYLKRCILLLIQYEWHIFLNLFLVPHSLRIRNQLTFHWCPSFFFPPNCLALCVHPSWILISVSLVFWICFLIAQAIIIVLFRVGMGWIQTVFIRKPNLGPFGFSESRPCSFIYRAWIFRP